jgi:hypothetical protein
MIDRLAPPSPGTKLILPHFTRSTVTRSLVVWLLVRVAATIASVLPDAAGAVPSPLRISPIASLYVVGIVTAVGWLGARISNEDTFLLCLGHGRRRQMAMHAAPALLAELAIRLAVGR